MLHFFKSDLFWHNVIHNKKHVKVKSKTYFLPRKRTNKLRNISPTGKKIKIKKQEKDYFFYFPPKKLRGGGRFRLRNFLNVMRLKFSTLVSKRVGWSNFPFFILLARRRGWVKFPISRTQFCWCKKKGSRSVHFFKAHQFTPFIKRFPVSWERSPASSWITRSGSLSRCWAEWSTLRKIKKSIFCWKNDKFL